MKTWQDLTKKEQEAILRLYPHLDTQDKRLRIIFRGPSWTCFHVKGE